MPDPRTPDRPADIDRLRAEHPAWRIDYAWTSAASGPGVRRLAAVRESIRLTAWDPGRAIGADRGAGGGARLGLMVRQSAAPVAASLAGIGMDLGRRSERVRPAVAPHRSVGATAGAALHPPERRSPPRLPPLHLGRFRVLVADARSDHLEPPPSGLADDGLTREKGATSRDRRTGPGLRDHP